MLRRIALLVLTAFCGAVALGTPAGAQAQMPYYVEVLARARIFPDVGAGLRAIKRDADGRYYILTAPGPAVLLYDAAGKRTGQIPSAPTKETALIFGDDFDVDAGGRVYVADRGANSVKVFRPDSALELTVAVAGPTSIVALDSGEFAVASMKTPRLVTVFSGPAAKAGSGADAPGKVVREFGDPTEIADRLELNRFLNVGRLAGDGTGHIYYAFSYLPEPTVRKYDRYGYASFEIRMTTLEFQPVAQAARREIARQERGGAPILKPIVTAVGVDPATQEIWVALGGLLLHFDKDGNRRGTYRTFTPEGARLEATTILIEVNRLLLGSDPLGIYEFPRPDKSRP